MIDLIQSLHISWFHAQHLRMIETLSFPWLGNALHLHQAHSQFLRVHLKSLRNLHFQQKYPQKRKWYRQATSILRDYMRGGTSNRARTIRSYLLGTRRRIQVRNTVQTILPTTNRHTDRTEINERLPADNVPD
jgi:hypothetical protein